MFGHDHFLSWDALCSLIRNQMGKELPGEGPDGGLLSPAPPQGPGGPSFRTTTLTPSCTQTAQHTPAGTPRPRPCPGPAEPGQSVPRAGQGVGLCVPPSQRPFHQRHKRKPCRTLWQKRMFSFYAARYFLFLFSSCAAVRSFEQCCLAGRLSLGSRRGPGDPQ